MFLILGFIKANFLPSVADRAHSKIRNTKFLKTNILKLPDTHTFMSVSGNYNRLMFKSFVLRNFCNCGSVTVVVSYILTTETMEKLWKGRVIKIHF